MGYRVVCGRVVYELGVVNVNRIAKSLALGLLTPGTPVTVTGMWQHVDGNEWREVNIPLRMRSTRTVEKQRSRDVVLDTGSHVDVMGAVKVWYYVRRWTPVGYLPSDVYDGPFVKIVWSNMAIEYDIGGDYGGVDV